MATLTQKSDKLRQLEAEEQEAADAFNAELATIDKTGVDPPRRDQIPVVQKLNRAWDAAVGLRKVRATNEGWEAGAKVKGSTELKSLVTAKFRAEGERMEATAALANFLDDEGRAGAKIIRETFISIPEQEALRIFMYRAKVAGVETKALTPAVRRWIEVRQ